MKLRILRSALNDLAAGRRFYDRQQKGVGDYFFDSLFSDIDSLVIHAGVHRIQFGFHRMLATRFPYVYYRIVGNETIVFRIIDCRRDPKWIRSVLEENG